MLQKGNVVIFETPAEMQTGLGRFVSVPVGLSFLFPFAGHPARVHSYNMREPIFVYELTRNMELVRKSILEPLRIMDLDPKTIHVMESSLKTIQPVNFHFLKEHVQ